MKRLGLAGAVLLLILVVLLIGVFFIDFDSPELGRMALSEASELAGIAIDAERFSLNLSRGLILEGVTASGGRPGARYDLVLGRLVFEHRLLPLLSGTVAVERILLEGPTIELDMTDTTRPSTEPGESDPGPSSKKGAAEAPEQTATESSGAGLDLLIDEIALRNGEITIRQRAKKGKGESAVRVTALEIDLGNLSFDSRALSPIHAVAGAGSIRTRRVALDSTHIDNVDGDLRVADGRFELNELAFDTEEGHFKATMAVDFNNFPFTYELRATGDPLDLNAMVVAEEGFGPGRIELEAEGFGTDSKDFNGSGVLHLEEGRLPSHAALASAEQAIGRTGIVGSRYQATEAPFNVRSNRITLESLVFDSEQLGIDLEGWADIDGPVSFDMMLRTPRAGLEIKEVPDSVLDVLTDERGWVAIPFDVRGARDDPKVVPDTKALMSQARRGTEDLVKEKAEDAAKDLIKGFLKKN